ncbi:MAG: 30S ribosomal protein S5 [Candidatus Marinimicrobia bacterium]|nr:30S ribosomal protein S5 [Candidatus Neomarinimicrobiota bacterium]
MNNLFINPSDVELKEESVICINRVSKATKGGRRMRFNSLVVVGDGNGHFGIGFGKANDVAMAVSKAKEKAKKRIIKVALVNGTIPHRVDIKHGSVRLMLKPAGPGTGIIAGGPIREVLQQLGVKNILSKNTGSTNAINVVRAVEKALGDMKDPLMMAKQRGITVKQLFG